MMSSNKESQTDSNEPQRTVTETDKVPAAAKKTKGGRLQRRARAQTIREAAGAAAGETAAVKALQFMKEVNGGVFPDQEEVMAIVSQQTQRESELMSRCSRLQDTMQKWDKVLQYCMEEDAWVNDMLLLPLELPPASQELRELREAQEANLQLHMDYEDLLERRERCLQFSNLLMQFGAENEEVKA